MIALQRVNQPGEVVFVRVRQHDERQVAFQKGKRAPEAVFQRLRVGPAVDQGVLAARRLDQQRVALPHVERPEVQQAVGPPEDGRR